MRTILLGAVTLLIGLSSQGLAAGLAHSPNFIISADDQALADAVLTSAESYRKQLAHEWLGGELSPDAKRVVIRVIVSDEKDYGLTRIEEDPVPEKCHSVWIVTSADRINSTLAHEMTHIIFGCQCHDRIPIWANEGAASLQDDARRANVRRRIIQELAQHGDWPELITILDSYRISPSDQRSYAISASLTEFLLTLDSKRTFLQFTIEGKGRGWDAALLRYYGIRNIRQLQSRWQKWVQHGHAQLEPMKSASVKFKGHATLVRHLPDRRPRHR